VSCATLIAWHQMRKCVHHILLACSALETGAPDGCRNRTFLSFPVVWPSKVAYGAQPHCMPAAAWRLIRFFLSCHQSRDGSLRIRASSAHDFHTYQRASDRLPDILKCSHRHLTSDLVELWGFQFSYCFLESVFRASMPIYYITPDINLGEA
jgi:hypothetical protein